MAKACIFSFNLLPFEPEHLKLPEEKSLPINFEMAEFAFKMLQGSFFSPQRLKEDSVFSSILATLYIIEWENDLEDMNVGLFYAWKLKRLF
jgi:hypothetical protein